MAFGRKKARDADRYQVVDLIVEHAGRLAAGADLDPATGDLLIPVTEASTARVVISDIVEYAATQPEAARPEIVGRWLAEKNSQLDKLRAADNAVAASGRRLQIADCALARTAGREVLKQRGYTLVIGHPENAAEDVERGGPFHQVGIKLVDGRYWVAFVDPYVADEDPPLAVRVIADGRRVQQGTRPYLLDVLTTDPRWQAILAADSALTAAYSAEAVDLSYDAVRVSTDGGVLVTPYVI